MYLLPLVLLFSLIKGSDVNIAQALELNKLHKELNNLIVPANLGKVKNLLQSVAEVNDTCVYSLSRAINHFYTRSTLSDLLVYSGLGINKFGNYRGCKKLNESYYATIALSISHFVAMSIGLCLPNDCSVSYLSQYKGKIADYLKAITYLNITKDNILMLDVAKENEELIKLPTEAIILIAIFLAWVAIVIGCSILHYQKKLDLREDPSSVWKRICKSFSFQNNFAGLLSTRNKYDINLNAINGVKVFAMLWILFGHTFYTLVMLPVMNTQDIFYDAKYSYIMALSKSALHGVDIFFFLSGFLATLGFYIAFRKSEKSKVSVILLAYFQRYMRLLPILFITYAFFTFFLVHLFDTPTSPFYKEAEGLCRDQIYWYFSYINNFINSLDDMCVGWTWYICCDMQFFIILPFFILLYCKRRSLGLWVIFGASTVCVIIQFWLAFHYNFTSILTRQRAKGDFDGIFYIKPYCRIVPYFMGCFFFLMYEESRNEENGLQVFVSLKNLICDNRIFRYICYLIGSILILLCIYSHYHMDAYEEHWTDGMGTVHLVLGKPILIFGIMLILFPIFCGKGRILFHFISNSAFCFLSKVAFGVYMVQLLLAEFEDIAKFQTEYYEVKIWMVKYFKLTAFSTLVSLVVTILFESPIMMLFKAFLIPPSKSKKEDLSPILSPLLSPVQSLIKHD